MLRIAGAAIVAMLAISSYSVGPSEKDPHRPQCLTERCRKIESFLKAHYCGESPFANGPDDSCDIRDIKGPQRGVKVVADYSCKWSDKHEVVQCEQQKQPSSQLRDALVRDLHRIGLRPKAAGETYFRIFKSSDSGWSVADASYSRLVDSEAELCGVIALVDRGLHTTVLRKVPFQKTDTDKPTVTQWSLIDLADMEGTGDQEILLKGDEYENHWLEVIDVHDGTVKTIFSGLGYYL